MATTGSFWGMSKKSWLKSMETSMLSQIPTTPRSPTGGINMENFCMHSWHTVGEAPPYTLPESDRDIYILVEDDVVYDSRDYWPEVRKACLVSYSDGGFKWK